MAVPGVATRNQHTVSALLQRLYNVERIDPARTGYADHAHVRRILKAAYTSQVGASIRTPVAEERNNGRFSRVIRLSQFCTPMALSASPSTTRAWPARSRARAAPFTERFIDHGNVFNRVKLYGTVGAHGNTRTATAAHFRTDA